MCIRDRYAAIKEYKVGGLLFSSGQLSNQVLLTNYAQSLAEVPLFITFDGEWGLAMRLKGTPRFPRNRVLGCIQDNEMCIRDSPKMNDSAVQYYRTEQKTSEPIFHVMDGGAK